MDGTLGHAAVSVLGSKRPGAVTVEEHAPISKNRVPRWHRRDGEAVVIVFGRVAADTRCRVAVSVGHTSLVTLPLGRVRWRRSQHQPLFSAIKRHSA